jgi:hypothetical protein
MFADTHERDLVTTEAIGQEARDPPHGRDTDTGNVMDLAIGKTLLEEFDYVPTIDERLELRRGAQIAQEIAAFVNGIQTDNRLAQRFLGPGLLPFGLVSVGFHCCTSVLMY